MKLPKTPDPSLTAQAHAHRFYQFGPFLLDTRERRLLCEGEPVVMRAKVFDTLVVLVANRGTALEKGEMMQAIWPDTFVEEGNLTQNISRLRKALSDGDRSCDYIETLPGRGYRFVAEVRELPGQCCKNSFSGTVSSSRSLNLFHPVSS